MPIFQYIFVLHTLSSHGRCAALTFLEMCTPPECRNSNPWILQEYVTRTYLHWKLSSLGNYSRNRACDEGFLQAQIGISFELQKLRVEHTCCRLVQTKQQVASSNINIHRRTSTLLGLGSSSGQLATRHASWQPWIWKYRNLMRKHARTGQNLFLSM